ncbi:MAG: sulfatase [Opitutales bacterium]
MSSKPNILAIFVDDLRPELNCFGRHKLYTPAIDALAARSTRYERAYCQFPQCMPSRASMLSGVRPQQFCNKSEQLLASDQPTMPAHFKASGYKTVSVGKVYHEPLDDQHSWDELHRESFREKAPGQFENEPHDYKLPENQAKALHKQAIPFPEFRNIWEPLPPLSECAEAPDETYIDHKIATRAVDVIERHHDDAIPLFLAVGFVRPHLPWVAPKWAWDLYDRDSIELADNPFFPENAIGKSDLCDFMHYGDREATKLFSDIGRYADDDFPVLSEAKQRECIHAYWASVSFMDAQVGRLMQTLDRLRLADNTVVLFWGDNGWHLGEHKLWSKVTHFDESTRVPLLLSVPGRTTGEVCRALVEITDIYPTLCALSQTTPPVHLEGQPLPFGAAATEAKTAKPASASGWNGYTLLTDAFRVTWYPRAEEGPNPSMISGRGQWELFDHRNDPRENRNVASDPAYAEMLESLKAQLFERYPNGASLKPIPRAF